MMAAALTSAGCVASPAADALLRRDAAFCRRFPTKRNVSFRRLAAAGKPSARPERGSGLTSRLNAADALAVVGGRGAEPAHAGAREVARIGKADRVGDLGDAHFGMRQGIVGELTAAAVEELGKAHLLILKASLQLACRKIELLLPIQSNRYLANHLQASATPINVSMPDVHPCLLTRSNAGMSGRPPNKALWRYSK